METLQCPVTKNTVAEVELVYKTKVKASLRPAVKMSQDAYQLLLSAWDSSKLELVEECKVLLLTQAGKVIAIHHISTGSVNGTVVDPRIVLIAALKVNATSIILSHNHPSGNLTPSQADKLLTSKIQKACAFFDMVLSDHLIITNEAYFSFADTGLL